MHHSTAHSATHSTDRTDRSGLEALLTPARARLLAAVAVERSMADIAGLLHSVPAAATHQVNALESAGLVRRRRDGRRIWVQRTPRGNALLDLYGLQVPRA
ncbi:helix-turn-helix domain-containing protein [Pseudonocardia sp. HH130630-07]|uniref:helix-turn-helix domain-containing protein n=1 Tax=Pseudonocardia sp. HH130630-07 TaxID=1690815 RepID=UPI000814E04E|nr:helix-turn-helix domain-containing protein [Pseudonocardia sp. HH130630-07]ANY05826.1 hypothetical protein AFB00_05395 [Pseudonocardia sp. HH130630-07]